MGGDDGSLEGRGTVQADAHPLATPEDLGGEGPEVKTCPGITLDFLHCDCHGWGVCVSGAPLPPPPELGLWGCSRRKMVVFGLNYDSFPQMGILTFINVFFLFL